MNFKFIKNESEYPNEQYLVRAYGDLKGIMISDFNSIKTNCVETKEYCLVEKKTNYYILSWDLDFKDKLDECYRDNHEKITKYIIEKINESIDYLTINADKSYVYAESTKGLGKHIYYIFMIVDQYLHTKIRNIIMEKIKKENKYNYELIDNIIDVRVCKSTGIRLFGCVKDDGYYYPVKEKSTYNIAGNIEDDFKFCLLNTTAIKYNFNLKFDFDDNESDKDDSKTLKQSSTINKEYFTNKTEYKIEYKKINDINLEEINELLDIIQEKNKKYEDWINVGLSLHTTNNSVDMRNLWFNWSLKNYKWESKQFNTPEEEINYKWTSFKEIEKPLTLGTIKKIAKDFNIEKYVEWFNKYNKKSIVILIKDFDQQTVANYYKNKKPNDYIFKDGNWYMLLENNLWRKTPKRDDSKLKNDITEIIKQDLIELKNILKPEDDLLKLIPTVSKKLGTSKFISGVIDYLYDKYRNEHIEFDMKSNLFGFNNLVYDLETNIFRNYQKEDLITITTGYDWKEPEKQEIQLVTNILKQIHPNEILRNFYLDILCSGLWGVTLQNFIIFNGSGSNGKSMFNDLMLKAVGNYGHIIKSSMLSEKIKQGANTDVANMDRKRYIVSRETDEHQKISNSIVKEYTGGSGISARKLYENEDKTVLHLTLVLECNKKPKLTEEPTEGDARRIVDLLFESKFTKDKDLINNTNIFESNVEFVKNEFREKYKYSLIKILFEHNKNNYKKELIIPDIVKKRTTQYMEQSFEIFEWFNETFHKIENYSENDYVSISDINEILKTSEYFGTLSKNEKRKITREKLITLFMDNPFYKKYYQDEINTYKNGMKVFLPKRLIGYKIKENL